MKLLTNQRRSQIYRMIEEDGMAKVTALSKIFKVSEVTIRQDLESLEKKGVIKRQYGGAYLCTIENQVRSFSLQPRENDELKEKIGEKAASYINDFDTIILDSGTTTTRIVSYMKGLKDVTIITNALNIATIAGTEPGINVMVTGGEFKAPTLSLSGEKAAQFFKGLHVDKLFLATAGISLKSGLTYPSISDIPVKRAMIECADKVYLVADSSKIGKCSLASLGALGLIDYLITDSQIADKDKQVFIEHNIEFIIAD